MEPAAQSGRRSRLFHIGREPLVLIWLLVLAVVMFSVVGWLSSRYTHLRDARANDSYNKGVNELRRGNVQQAVTDFRVALTYSPDDFDSQVKLAQALVALNRPDEAKVYLAALWQREPENGTVNLELARLYAKAGDVNNALRYYHDAIYAIWTDKAEQQQISVRLELAEFLLSKKLEAQQAEAELIALGSSLPEDPAIHARVGNLFLQVPAYNRALREFQDSLRLDPDNAVAVAGAGSAAFDLGRYPMAIHYLQEAIAQNPSDSNSQQLLATAKMIREMDPQLRPPSKRAPIILADSRQAGLRLTSCIAQLQSKGQTLPADLQDLNSRWTAAKAHLTERSLRRNPDEADSVADLAYNIEEQTSDVCGKPSGADLALLLIAQSNEGD